MANVKRLAQKQKTVEVVRPKIYLINLLPFPAAESVAQRCKNAHRRTPLGSVGSREFCYIEVATPYQWEREP